MLEVRVLEANALDSETRDLLRPLTASTYSGLSEVLDDSELGVSQDYVCLGYVKDILVGWSASVLYSEKYCLGTIHVFVDPKVRGLGYGLILGLRALELTQRYPRLRAVKVHPTTAEQRGFMEKLRAESKVPFILV